MTADLFLVHGGLWDTMDAELASATNGCRVVGAGLSVQPVDEQLVAEWNEPQPIEYVWLQYLTMGEAQSSHPARSSGSAGEPQERVRRESRISVSSCCSVVKGSGSGSRLRRRRSASLFSGITMTK